MQSAGENEPSPEMAAAADTVPEIPPDSFVLSSPHHHLFDGFPDVLGERFSPCFTIARAASSEVDPSSSPVDPRFSPGEYNDSEIGSLPESSIMPPISDPNSTINVFGENHYPLTGDDAKDRVVHHLKKFNAMYLEGKANNKRNGNRYDMQGHLLIDATYEFLAMSNGLRILTSMIADLKAGSTEELCFNSFNIVRDTSPKLFGLLPQTAELTCRVAEQIADLEYQNYFVERVKENLYNTFDGIKSSLISMDTLRRSDGDTDEPFTYESLLNIGHDQVRESLAMEKKEKGGNPAENGGDD